MQALIIENKWLILFILEFLAWAMTFFMLYTRYKIQSTFWFKIALILLHLQVLFHNFYWELSIL